MRLFADASWHANAAMKLAALLSTGLAQEMQSELRVVSPELSALGSRLSALGLRSCCRKVASAFSSRWATSKDFTAEFAEKCRAECAENYELDFATFGDLPANVILQDGLVVGGYGRLIQRV